MRNIKHISAILTLVTTLLLTSHGKLNAMEKDVASQVNSANQLLRDGKFQDAIERYRQAQENEQSSDTITYNLGVASFRSGDLAKASELFSQAALASDRKIAAESRYNLGNCLYTEALQLPSSEKPLAISKLKDAISHYRSSLRLDRNNSDARANIELANEMIRQLEDERESEDDQQQQEQESSPQNQEQDQQNQEQQSSSEQSQQDSQENSSSDQSQSQSQSQDSTNSEQNDQSDDQRKGEQEQQSETEQEEQNQNEQEQDAQQQNDQQSESAPDTQQSNAQPNRSDSNASNDQQDSNRDESTAESNEEEPDGENKEIPQGNLTAAGDNEKQANESGEAVRALADSKDGLMTKEEALKLLQAVRDRDMLRRLRQQQQERSRRVPVERDW